MIGCRRWTGPGLVTAQGWEQFGVYSICVCLLITGLLRAARSGVGVMFVKDMLAIHAEVFTSLFVNHGSHVLRELLWNKLRKSIHDTEDRKTIGGRATSVWCKASFSEPDAAVGAGKLSRLHWQSEPQISIGPFARR